MFSNFLLAHCSTMTMVHLISQNRLQNQFLNALRISRIFSGPRLRSSGSWRTTSNRRRADCSSLKSKHLRFDFSESSEFRSSALFYASFFNRILVSSLGISGTNELWQNFANSAKFWSLCQFLRFLKSWAKFWSFLIPLCYCTNFHNFKWS